MSNKKKLSSKQILGGLQTSSFLFTSSSPGGVCRRGPWVDGNNDHWTTVTTVDSAGKFRGRDLHIPTSLPDTSVLVFNVDGYGCLLVWGPGGPRDSKGTPFCITPFHFWGYGIPGIQTTGTPNQQLTISWLGFNNKNICRCNSFVLDLSLKKKCQPFLSSPVITASLPYQDRSLPIIQACSRIRSLKRSPRWLLIGNRSI